MLSPQGHYFLAVIEHFHEYVLARFRGDEVVRIKQRERFVRPANDVRTVLFRNA